MDVGVSLVPFADLIEPAYEALPFTVGEGPFHIKGTALRGALAFYATQPGGLARVRDAVADPRLHRFFDEPSLAGTWNDVFVSVAIDFAAARAYRQSAEQWLTESTIQQARGLLRGVYKALLSMFTPSAMTWSVSRISGTFFDFGEISTVERGPELFVAEVVGVPVVIAGWWQRVASEFAVEALRVRGFADASCEWTSLRECGVQRGLRVCRMTMAYRWTS